MTPAQLLGSICIGVLGQMGLQLAASAHEFNSGGGKDWTDVGGNTSNQRYSSLQGIREQNVSRLGGAWKSAPFMDGASSRSTPVVHGGLMFVNAGARVYALDAVNGKLVWSWLPDEHRVDGLIATLRAGFGVPNYQGVAVGNGAVYVGLMDGKVAALEEKTGRVLWTHQIGEEPRRIGQAISVAPTFTRGVVLAGLANGDFGLRGRITALDARTGKELWHFMTVPGPGEAGHESWDRQNDTWKIGGGGVWQFGNVDEELGLVYYVVGNTTPSWGGELREGDNLYTSSLVALDVKTGREKWHFQAIHHDIWDGDVATAPVLFDRTVAGHLWKAVAVLRSDGYLFILDRKTGKPLVPVEERPVPQSLASKSSRTQPFPAGGESLLPDCSFWKDKLPAGFVCGETFTPPSMPPPSNDPPNVLAPMFGVRNTPMSFSPQTGMLYVHGNASLDWRRRAADPYFWAFFGFVPDQKAFAYLAAFDTRTSRLVWRQQVPPETLGQGGSLATAGGLLFRLTGEGTFAAYKAATGELAWQFQTGFHGGSGSPSSYEVNGEQYVAVAVGQVVWAFKLNGPLREPATTEHVPSPYGDFSFLGGYQNTDRIETTKLQSDAGGLGGTRYYVDPYSFDPPQARVKVGTDVTFGNRGHETYTVVARDGTWTTGPIPVTEERKVRFDKPGLYTYTSQEHPWSYGQIRVVGDEVAANGVYSAQQATRGQDLYARNCAGCHQETLQGNGSATSLVGATFAAHWNDKTFADLFQRMSTTMPQNRPGGLPRQDYLDILGYILQANDFPAGPAALAADSTQFSTSIGTARAH